MKLRSFGQSTLAALLVVASSPLAWAGAISISGDVIAGKPITVKGSVGDIISLYLLTAPATCPTGAPLPFSVGAAASAANYTLTQSSVKLTPTTVFKADDLVCVTGKTGASAATSSVIMKVKAAPGATDDLSLSGILTAPSTISVYGTIGATVTAYLLVKPKLSCNKQGINGAEKALPFKVGAGSSGTEFTLTDTTTVFTLDTPANRDDQLCLTATLKAGGSVGYALVVPLSQQASRHVAPAQEPDFAHSFYTFGAVASNQLSTTNSTSAAQYVDFGWSFHWIDEGDKSPGFNTSFSGRFTSMPVAAKTNAAASSTAGATPFNILSTQESVRIMASVSLPSRAMALTPYDESSGFPKAAIFLAPIARGSFSTLINPTSTVTAPQGGTPSVLYAPTYNDWSLGAALGLRHYQAPTEKRHGDIETIAKLDITMGKFSNLQDVVCGTLAVPSGTGSTTAPINTSCYQTGTNTAGKTTFDSLLLNRKSIPRLELDGFYRIVPGPLVIGIDANLSQYSLLIPKRVDTLNRAGSDVRIYFGVTGNLGDLCTQLKLCKQ